MSNTPSDAEILALAQQHLKAFAQFTGAGEVWFEGEVEFARAVLAKWGTPQPVVREPWLPIETAPRDGTAVLVMRDIWPGTKSGRAEQCNGHNTYVAQWWDGERGGDGSWVCYMDAVCDPECPIVPTHWKPLPPPPSITHKGGSNAE